MNHTFQVIDPKRVREVIDSGENVGFCTICGAERGNTEPDARNYECEHCGSYAVLGAEELLAEYF